MWRCAFLTVLLTGCGFDPVSGAYVFTEGDVETDCETADAGSAEEEAFTVDVAVDAERAGMDLSYPTVAEDGSPSSRTIPCTLDGRDFDCGETETAIDMAPTYDAVFTVSSHMSGTWTGNRAMDLTAVSSTTCAGEDCDALDELGMSTCSTTATMTGELREE